MYCNFTEVRIYHFCNFKGLVCSLRLGSELFSLLMREDCFKASLGYRMKNLSEKNKKWMQWFEFESRISKASSRISLLWCFASSCDSVRCGLPGSPGAEWPWHESVSPCLTEGVFVVWFVLFLKTGTHNPCLPLTCDVQIFTFQALYIILGVYFTNGHPPPPHEF